MRKLVFSINVSLDGFADHTVAIADDELHEFFTAQLNTIDTALFGRVTYQMMANYWPLAPKDPKSSKSIIEFANKFNAMPKIVFSRTLQNVSWNNTRLIKEDMVREVERLKQENGGSLDIGGISTIQTFMKLKLVDECWLLVHPVIAGKGRRLFDGVNDRRDLKLVDTKKFRSGVIVLHYLLSK